MSGTIRDSRFSHERKTPLDYRALRCKKLDSFYVFIKATAACASIAYLCDAGLTEGNLSKIQAAFDGLTVLCAECMFLSTDQVKAYATNHLCGDDLNQLLTLLCPCWLLPMHLSQSYFQTLHRACRYCGNSHPEAPLAYCSNTAFPESCS